MGKSSADYAIRVGGRFFVGCFGGNPIYARRPCFAARFVVWGEARKFVRGDLSLFAPCIDSIRIVRMVPRKARP